MLAPTSAQAAAAATLAGDIVDYVVSKFAVPQTEMAKGCFGAGIEVRVQPVVGEWGDLDKFWASHGISVGMPTGNVYLKSNRRYDVDVRRILCGALLHELTHVLQAGANPSGVAAAQTIQNNLGTPTTPAGWLTYYRLLVELEAHGVQAAGELFYVHGAGLPQTSVTQGLSTTHVYSRVAARLGVGSPWFTGFEAAAWQAYSSW